jgi:signal peptidase II
MNPRLRSALIILAVVAVDRASKLAIRAQVSPWETIPVIAGIFNIVHAENPGAAFSMLADAPPLIRGVFLIGVSLLLMAIIGSMLWRLPAKSGVVFSTALALVFGGALGNLWDRVARGTVTDFVQVFIGSYEFPSFNVADSAITVGAALLAVDLLRGSRRAA